MRTESIIGITFKGHDSKPDYWDNNGNRKPFLFHIPNTHGLLWDSKCFGIMFDFCNAIAEKDEDPIVLEVVTSDEEENLEGWIPVHEIMKGNYESLPNYKGEWHGGGRPMYFRLTDVYPFFNPKYIYIRKRKDIRLEVPDEFDY